MGQPKVSVIIPVYNTEKYLRQCLDSVVNQTLKEIEIICVDDGSTDSSLEILREYEQKDSRVKVLCQRNQYAGVARNNGMAVASGEYYVFLDADDFFEPELLELQYKKGQELEADVVLCGADQYDQRTGKHIETSWFLPKRYIRRQPINRSMWPEKIFQVTTLAPWNKMFSARFVAEHGLKFQALPRANDVYFTMTSLALAERIAAVDFVLVHYRVGMSDNLQANNHRSPLAFCEALEAVRDRLQKENIFEEVWVSFANNALSQSVYNLKKLQGNDAGQCLAEKLYTQWMDMFGICRGIEEEQLDKTFSRELMKLLEENRFPCLQQRENGMAWAGEKPCVSVIVPVYNVERYLRECLDSIEKQTLRNMEIICVNDGSTDNSGAILEEYRQKDSRIRVITQKNAGVSAARNAGMDAAEGKYLLFIDSDDYLEENAAERLSVLCEENKLDLLFFDLVSFYDETGEVRPSRTQRNGYNRVYDGVSLLNRMRKDRTYITSVCLVMLRREFLQENGINFYPGIIHEDELFCFRMLMEATRTAFVDWKLYYRRVRENSIMTTQKSAKNVMGYFTCMREILRYGLTCDWGQEKNTEIVRFFDSMRRATRHVYQQISDEEKGKLQFNDAFSELLFEQFVLEIASEPAAMVTASSVSTGADSQRERILMQKNKMLEQEIRNIHASATYKIGRIITWMPRKMRGLLRCYQEHGVAYTWERILVHLGLQEDPYKMKPITPVKQSVVAPAEKPVVPELTQEEQYQQRLTMWYKQRSGKELDLDNVQTLNEKIQWLKLYDNLPLKTLLADKYLYRGWVEKEFGSQYLIPLLGVWDHFDEIDLDKLPEQFVMKTNHGSSWNIIVRNKAEFDAAVAKKKITGWLGTNFALAYGLEMHYMNIVPRIIAEEYHPCRFEYQYWCFNGEPKFISAIHEPHGENAKATYDLNWNKLNFVTSLPRLTEELERPPVLEEMNRIARAIGEKFAFVRVDFLYDEKNLFVGEITFTPASGICRWDPGQYDQILGEMLTLPPKSPIPERLV